MWEYGGGEQPVSMQTALTKPTPTTAFTMQACAGIRAHTYAPFQRSQISPEEIVIRTGNENDRAWLIR